MLIDQISPRPTSDRGLFRFRRRLDQSAESKAESRSGLREWEKKKRVS